MEEDDGVEGDGVECGLSEQEGSECESDAEREDGAAGDSGEDGGEDVSSFITFPSLTSLA